MSIQAQFTNQPSNGNLAQVSAANANRDGSGTVVTVYTAGAYGGRIERIALKAVVTTTAGMVRLFLQSGGVTRLIHEELVAAITPSATVAAFSANISGGAFPLVMQPGAVLIACTEKAEAINVVPVEAGNF
jgi:PKD repeat protein